MFDTNKAKKQLENNLNDILGGYMNGMDDYPDEYPQMTLDKCISYCIPDIYDQISDGAGFTRYREGICDNLKFLGNDYIYSEIKRIADECGILKEE